MCHLVLMMPVIGLGVFWLWPFSVAMPVYLVILFISGLVYFALLKAMSRPVVTGKEGLIGRTVEIMDISGYRGHVRVHGEIWEAYFQGSFQKADKGIVKEVRDMTLVIEKESAFRKQAPAAHHHH